MKTYFNDIYLPVKRGITGHIFGEKHSLYADLISEIQVNYEPDKPVGKWVIYAIFRYKNQGKRFYYGKSLINFCGCFVVGKNF